MNEPSVLDYIKSLIAPWKYPKVSIPDHGEDEPFLESETEVPQTSEPEIQVFSQDEPIGEEIQPADQGRDRWFWLVIIALGVAFLAQISLEPSRSRAWIPGLILYIIALTGMSIAYLHGKWQLPSYKNVPFLESKTAIRSMQFALGLVLAIPVFLLSSGNRFTLVNLFLLVLSVIFLAWSFWQKSSSRLSWKITPWLGVVLGVFILAAFFRYYLIAQVPPEMNSDHAEKLLDVLRVLDGQTMIFFPNNGGREPLQFYLVAGLHRIFNLDLNFNILKFVTITAGFLTLPFIYFLGKDLVNRRVGLLALAFAAIAYWPNVVSRAGMRLPFYMLFTAATLYFLLRGLQTGRRNFFIFGGISLGISFYGYSADRILPLVVLLAVVLFVIHSKSKGHKQEVIRSTLLLLLIAFVILLPLLRFTIEDADSILFRTLTRMGSMERPLPESPLLIFLRNLGNALLMFSWDNGEVWVTSVPHRPALGVISAALFWIGVAALIIRYLRSRHWMDLFWLLSIPVLMLPSIMSLAFPDENPSLYRTGGAIVPVFLIVALALDGLMSAFRRRFPVTGARLAWGFAVLLLVLSSVQNYRLVFEDYFSQYRMSAWNSSEMARVVNEYTASTGPVDSVWVMAYPHWVDTRLIGILTGNPTRNFVIFPEQVETLPDTPTPKLFLIHPEDEVSTQVLEAKYPPGIIEQYESEVESKNFLLYYVPQGSN